jgi:hypothetical protein
MRAWNGDEVDDDDGERGGRVERRRMQERSKERGDLLLYNKANWLLKLLSRRLATTPACCSGARVGSSMAGTTLANLTEVDFIIACSPQQLVMSCLAYGEDSYWLFMSVIGCSRIALVCFFSELTRLSLVVSW